MKTSLQRIDSIREKAAVRMDAIKKRRKIIAAVCPPAGISLILVFVLIFNPFAFGSDNPVITRSSDSKATAAKSETSEMESHSNSTLSEKKEENTPQTTVKPKRAVKLSTFLYNGSGLETSAEITGQSLNLRYLNLSDDYAAIENKTGPFVYDVKSGKVLSMTEVMQEKLVKAGVIKSSDKFELSAYGEDHVIYHVNSVTFYYCFSKKLSKKAPIKLTYGYAECVSSDFRYYTVSEQRPAVENSLPTEDIYFADIINGTVKCLTRDSAGKIVYDAFTAGGMMSSLSPTSRYVTFMIRGAEGENQPYVIYDTKTDKSYTYKGYATSFSENDAFMFFKNSGGGYKMDCATGKISKLTTADQPGQGVTLNNFLDLEFSGSDKPGENQISVIDLRTGKKTAVSEPFSVYLIDDSKRYLYSYTDKAKTVECLDLATNERYSLKVDDAFLKEVAANRGDWRYFLDYQLYLNDDGSELLLTYRVTPPNDPDGKRETVSGAAYYLYRTQNNLDGFKEFVEPYGQFRFYTGNGFAYVEFEDSDYTYQMIEDYRSGRMACAYFEPGMKSLGFTFAMECQPLSKGRTAKDFAKVTGGMPTQTAEYDFASFLRADGSYSTVEVFNFLYNREKIKNIFTLVKIGDNADSYMSAESNQPEKIAWIIDYFMKRDLLVSFEEFNNNNSSPIPQMDTNTGWTTEERYTIGLSDGGDRQMLFVAGTLTKSGQKRYYLQTSAFFHCLVSESEYNRLSEFVNGLTAARENPYNY